MSDDEAALQFIEAWRSVDAQADAAIAALRRDPSSASPAIVARLEDMARRPDAPPELATLVTGGLVEKIVQIAHARDIIIVSGQSGNGRGGRELQSLLALPLNADGTPPRIRSVSCYDIGVSKSKYASAGRETPYVERNADVELRRHLLESPFVLVVGASKAGKSRTLFESLQSLWPEARLLVPRGEPAVLGDISGMSEAYSGLGERLVLWLDDIDRYLGPKGLDLLILDRFAGQDPPVTVAGTIRSARRDAVLNAPGDVGRTAQLVLGRAAVVTLSRTLRPKERSAAEHAYPQESFVQRGIGEQLVAAPLLEQRYDDGYESRPVGWAVVQAAIDWWRIGFQRPIDHDSLRRLFADYLSTNRPDFDADESNLAAGIAWAREPVAGSVALITATSADGEVAYRPFDYIVAYADGQRPENAVPIPEFSWRFAIDHSSLDDLLDVGFEASTRRETAVARSALRKVFDSQEPDISEWAALLLGGIEAQNGSLQEARNLLSRAADSADATIAELASADLAAVLMSVGEYGRARELLEAVLLSSNPQIIPMARANLGAVLLNLGERERAQELLEAALASGNSQAAPLAQANLAAILINSGQYEQARELLEAALAADDPQATPLAQANLAMVFVNAGDDDRARELLEAAVASRNPQIVPTAQIRLSMILIRSGDQERARELLDTALASVDPLAVPLAQLSLATILVNSGEHARARELLETALLSTDPQVVSLAQANLASVLINSGEHQRARELLEAALLSTSPQVVPMAQVNLGALLLNLGERERAQELLEAALSSGSSQTTALAEANLGGMLLNLGEYERGRELLEAALASGNPQAVPIAQSNLGAVLLNVGEYERGRELLEAALASGNPQIVPMAQANLGGMLLNLGEHERGRELLEAALASGNPQAMPTARVNLGAVLLNLGEYERARELLEPVLSSGIPHVVAMAQVDLGAVLMNLGEYERARELLEAALLSGHPLAVPLAQANLAVILVNAEEYERAQELLEAAISSGSPQALALARINLAGLFMTTGTQLDRARELLESTVATGSTAQVAQAQDLLGDLLNGLGDVDGAAAAYQAAIDGGDPVWAPTACTDLAVLRWQQEDTAAARELFERTIVLGSVKQVAQAQDLLGDLLDELGDVDGAAAAYQAAIDGGDPVWAPIACTDLALLRWRQQDTAAVRELLEHAIATGSPRRVLIATGILGDFLAQQGDTAGAVQAYQSVVDAGQPEFAATARRRLTFLPSRQAQSAAEAIVLARMNWLD